MEHPFSQYLVTRNNYLKNPQYAVELSKKQQYFKATYYPGLRTQNLLISEDAEVKQFAEEFVDGLSVDVFPGLENYKITLCFHINENYNDDILNQGWVHTDESLLAGLVYLNPAENNFDSGTSIFNGDGDVDRDSNKLRADFNISGNTTEQYVQSLKDNWSYFQETIRIGNVFNRLVAYDSKMFHRPNSYKTSDNTPRLSLLFFIYNFDYKYCYE